MARNIPWLHTVTFVLLAGVNALAQTSAPAPPPEESFYSKSLHFTNRGIEFIYSKEQGGLERITGLSASEAGCVKARCHATTCDTCHRKDVNGKATYSLDPAVAQAACEKCHGSADKDDPDVHVRKGMKCMACHSTREVHGDGVAYDTYTQPGVLDARCEKCHAGISKSASHTVHHGKVDCSACHGREYKTCLNCHVEGRIKGDKEVRIPLQAMTFLVNAGGRVTTANMLTYVYKNKTMITFAPIFSHSITKEGRACADCHASPIVRAISGGTFVPVRWEGGKATNVDGVIPVVDPTAWKLPFLAREDGKWTPLEGAAEPLLHYSGNCTPLTREQLASLVRPRGSN